MLIRGCNLVSDCNATLGLCLSSRDCGCLLKLIPARREELARVKQMRDGGAKARTRISAGCSLLERYAA